MTELQEPQGGTTSIICAPSVAGRPRSSGVQRGQPYGDRHTLLQEVHCGSSWVIPGQEHECVGRTSAMLMPPCWLPRHILTKPRAPPEDSVRPRKSSRKRPREEGSCSGAAPPVPSFEGFSFRSPPTTAEMSQRERLQAFISPCGGCRVELTSSLNYPPSKRLRMCSVAHQREQNVLDTNVCACVTSHNIPRINGVT